MARAVLIYLFAIVLPALILLALGLQSVQRQHQAVRVLAESNRVLASQTLSSRLEQRTHELAESCLDNRQGPLAQYYFVVQNGRVVQPLLETPAPREPQHLPPAFRDAETRELRQEHIAEALQLYRAVYESAAPDAVKALALSREARCLHKLGRQAQASEAWNLLGSRYGNLYDPAHRPYALVARVELNQIEGLYEDLISDRWDLSAEQFDYYLERLHRPAPAENRFALARELDDHFRPPGPLRTGETYAYALPHYKLYYRVESPGGRIAGLAVNSRWVSQTLAPTLRRELHLPDPDVPHVTESNRDLWIYGGAMVSVLAVLLLGIVFVVRDARRQVKLSQLRADFVSGVSHELKTPLTLIHLYGETLLRGGPFDEQERRGFYEIITRESERLNHLIQKVLSFSRIERGQKAYSLETGDLAAAIARIVEAYRNYLERAGFVVETSLAGTLPSVRFDPDAVTEAVVNLLDNAVKYSGESKFIGIRLRDHDGAAVFEVEDHGIGIAASEREKIFQRYYRIRNGHGKGGYGLGLFLVRHIMDAHLGRVEVESEPGAGSRFRLVFPAAA